ncbi:MAG: TetR/AcrR family transcriptional regulator [Aestuariivirga sp.]
MQNITMKKYDEAKHKPAPPTMDRRVTRTRQLLQAALNGLILKQNYETISVEDICRAANIGRSTFYTHFVNKDDLKRSGLNTLQSQLLDRQRQALSNPHEHQQKTLSFSLVMFEHASDHLDHYRAQVGNHGGSVALGSIRQMLGKLVRKEFSEKGKAVYASELPREVVVQYVVGAFLSVLTWWLDGGAKLPPQEIDAMFQRLIVEGIA